MPAKKASVKCGESLTIAQAADLYQQLRQAMEKSGNIELQADKVEKVDTAGLQLFIAANHELEKAGGGLMWKKPSETLLQAASTLGLAPFLSFDQHP